MLVDLVIELGHGRSRLEIEFAGEGSANGVAHRLVLGVMRSTLDGFFEPQLDLLVVRCIRIAAEQKAYRQLPLARIIRGDVEKQLMPIGEQLTRERIQA